MKVTTPDTFRSDLAMLLRDVPRGMAVRLTGYVVPGGTVPRWFSPVCVKTTSSCWKKSSSWVICCRKIERPISSHSCARRSSSASKKSMGG